MGQTCANRPFQPPITMPKARWRLPGRGVTCLFSQAILSPCSDPPPKPLSEQRGDSQPAVPLERVGEGLERSENPGIVGDQSSEQRGRTSTARECRHGTRVPCGYDRCTVGGSLAVDSASEGRRAAAGSRHAMPSQRGLLRGSSGMCLAHAFLLVFALPMIAQRGPGPCVPGFRWKPSVHWLCKAQ